MRPLPENEMVCRAMEGPRAGISNVEQHVNQLEHRLEDCLAHKADAAAVPTTAQVCCKSIVQQNNALHLIRLLLLLFTQVPWCCMSAFVAYIRHNVVAVATIAQVYCKVSTTESKRLLLLNVQTISAPKTTEGFLLYIPTLHSQMTVFVAIHVTQQGSKRSLLAVETSVTMAMHLKEVPPKKRTSCATTLIPVKASSDLTCESMQVS